MKRRLLILFLVVAAGLFSWSLRHQNTDRAGNTSATDLAGTAPDTAGKPGEPSANPAKPAGSTGGEAKRSTAATRKPTSSRFGDNGPTRLEMLPPGHFRTQLEKLPPLLRERVLAKLDVLKVPTNNVASLFVDSSGALGYECTFPGILESVKTVRPKNDLRAMASAGANGPGQAGPTLGVSVPIATPPLRHSRPGASRVLYLDFNGHTVTGTAWNSSRGGHYLFSQTLRYRRSAADVR